MPLRFEGCDNVEADIGFSGDSLDVSALATIVVRPKVLFRGWYDQSGNANNATQTTDSNQPRIYDGSKYKLKMENLVWNLIWIRRSLRSINWVTHSYKSVGRNVSKPVPTGTTKIMDITFATLGGVYWLHFIQRVGSVHKDRFYYGKRR